MNVAIICLASFRNVPFFYACYSTFNKDIIRNDAVKRQAAKLAFASIESRLQKLVKTFATDMTSGQVGQENDAFVGKFLKQVFFWFALLRFTSIAHEHGLIRISDTANKLWNCSLYPEGDVHLSLLLLRKYAIILIINKGIWNYPYNY